MYVHALTKPGQFKQGYVPVTENGAQSSSARLHVRRPAARSQWLRVVSSSLLLQSEWALRAASFSSSGIKSLALLGVRQTLSVPARWRCGLRPPHLQGCLAVPALASSPSQGHKTMLTLGWVFRQLCLKRGLGAGCCMRQVTPKAGERGPKRETQRREPSNAGGSRGPCCEHGREGA